MKVYEEVKMAAFNRYIFVTGKFKKTFPLSPFYTIPT